MDKILAEAEQFIRQILTIAGNSLSADTIEAVEHYLRHDEYEMAFEGLFIDIMKLEKAPPIDLVESKRMGSC